MKKLFLIFLNVMLLAGIASAQYSRYYYQRVSLFAALPTDSSDIIFLGNSITDGAEWYELFKNNKIKNRGISGDIAKGVYDRIEPIAKGKPSKIFLKIGINDLGRDTHPDTIARYVDMTIKKIQTISPKTSIYLQSVLPVNDTYRKFSDMITNKNGITTLNERLIKIAKDNNILYIDLYKHFKDKDNKLDVRYTNDGLHLTADGYMLWKNIINLYVNTDKKSVVENVFQNGDFGYASFRIPAIVAAKDGTLLAFAEGRKKSASDTGDIDLVLRRSYDSGKTWGDLIIVRDDGNNVCGNPAPIVDAKTGRIVLVSCWNLGTDHEYAIIDGKSKDTRKVFCQYSNDNGLTWSAPDNITSSVKKDNWTWYATGPCHGIQIQNGKYKGRIVVSANHMVAGTKEYHSQLIYSDDLGKTWILGGVVAENGGNESSVVELSNGDLMLNMRNYDRKEHKCRTYSISTDGGKTCGEMKFATQLIESVCQGSILNYTINDTTTNSILFSNPASEKNRNMMTIKLSKDNGNTWEYSHLVYSGNAAYSDMVIMPNGNVGILYEYGINSAYDTIGFECIDMMQDNEN